MFSKDKDYWKLNPDYPITYSESFSVENGYVMINGWHKYVGQGKIKYAVIKRNWFDFSAYYGSVSISGNSQDKVEYSHLFSGIPNGTGYYIEIMGIGLSYGKIAIKID